LLTIQELLESQRRTRASRCTHCGRDNAEHDHALVESALRARIRMLEERLAAFGATPTQPLAGSQEPLGQS
jgi:hypothetical protein